MEYGGSPAMWGGQCRNVCDGMPSPDYPGWERRTDDNNCPYWWTPPDAPLGCGVARTDGSVDVDASDVGTDVTPAADAQDVVADVPASDLDAGRGRTAM